MHLWWLLMNYELLSWCHLRFVTELCYYRVLKIITFVFKRGIEICLWGNFFRSKTSPWGSYVVVPHVSNLKTFSWFTKGYGIFLFIRFYWTYAHLTYYFKDILLINKQNGESVILVLLVIFALFFLNWWWWCYLFYKLRG